MAIFGFIVKTAYVVIITCEVVAIFGFIIKTAYIVIITCDSTVTIMITNKLLLELPSYVILILIM